MIKATERYLERSLSRGRKDISGKGAINTKVRIVDDCIFVKMKMDFSGLEKRMFRFILDRKEDACYYDSIRSEAKESAESILSEFCNVKIKDLDFKIDIVNGFSFSVIVLDADLENLIRTGEVTMPPKNAE